MAGLSGFSYYKTITINNTQVNADLANFPVYIPIVNDADIGGECLSTGYDIQFSDVTNDNVLTFERLPGFAVTSGQANGDFYVLVPTVTYMSETVIRCYYGKAGASDASSPENTFLAANGWSAVWHLEEASNPYLDVTSNNNDSTAGTYPDQATAKVGKGQDFVYTSTEYISIPTSTSLNFGATDDITITAWVRLDTSTGAIKKIINKSNNDFPYYSWEFGIRTDNYITTAIGDDAGSVSCIDWDHELALATWYHVGMRCDRDNVAGFATIYNGTLNPSPSNPTSIGDTTNTYACVIGARSGDVYDHNFDGIIDEVRISKTLRSDAWIKFEYYNSHDGHTGSPDNELTWGAEQSVGGVTTFNICVGEE